MLCLFTPHPWHRPPHPFTVPVAVAFPEHPRVESHCVAFPDDFSLPNTPEALRVSLGLVAEFLFITDGK